MNAGAKLAAYGLVLAGMIGGGAAIGATVGPIETGARGGEHGGGHAGDGPEATPATRDLPAGGLLVSQDGYSFDPATDRQARRKGVRTQRPVVTPSSDSTGSNLADVGRSAVHARRIVGRLLGAAY